MGGTPRKRGRAGNSRRDYSHLPRFEVIWDFEDGSYCCPRCGQPFAVLGDHVIEQVDWQVIVRLVVHRRRRYRRSCRCPVPATVMAPGPPKAIGKGLLSNGFIAQAWCERYVAGRSLHSLLAGLARHGAEISAGTVTGALAQAGQLLVGLEEAITARSRSSWHLHADETSWHVFAPRDGGGPARWWLWVFIAPGHDLLRDGPHPGRRRAGPPRRHRQGNRAARRNSRRRRAAEAGHLQRLLLGVHLGGG
ncbi:MAG: transposase [Pseudonocardiales bacterium]|nr:transposase [Pseudonocardiales bacterium]